MASQRSKRTIKAPKKYLEAEDQDDEDSLPPKRDVLRLVREDEGTDDLLDRVVYLFWEDDGSWYRAKIKKFDPATGLANIFYFDTVEKEDGTKLAVLIGEGKAAFRESRRKGHVLSENELELPEEFIDKPDPEGDVGSGSEEEEEGEEDDGEEDGGNEAGGDSDDDDDVSKDDDSRGGRRRGTRGRKRSRGDSAEDSSDGEGGSSGGPRAKKGTPPAAKGGKRAAQPGSGSGQSSAKRSRVEPPAASAPSKRQVTPSTKAQELLAAAAGRGRSNDEDFRAAERASKNLLASILGKKASSGAPTQQFYGGNQPKPQAKQAAASAAKLAKTASNVKETEFREKQRREMKESLTRALEELKAKGHEGDLPAPDMVAQRIEATMFKHFGGVNREYGARNRSIQFNLADKNNPDFRAKVLRGDLEPAKLMTMHTQEMASEEQQQWRAQKEEEALNNSVLDTATAARFSTAAALEARGRTGDGAAIDWRTNTLAASPPRTTPAEDAAAAAAEAAPKQEPKQAPLTSQPSSGGAAATSAGNDSGAKPTTNGTSAPSSAPLTSVAVPAFDWTSIKAQTLQEASKQKEQSPPAFKLEDDGLKKEIQDHKDTAGVSHDEVQAKEGTPPDDAKEPEGGIELDTLLDFSPDSFWDVLPDLAPLIASSSGRTPDAWSAKITVPGSQTYDISADYVGGTADISQLMGNAEVVIKGRLSLEVLEKFCEELRSSRSRTCTAALVRCTTAAEAFKELSDLYEGRQRCGVAQFGAGLEAYLLPGCELSERILKTAIRAAPLDTRGTIPRAIGAAEMLLLFVHRRDWQQMERPTTAEPKAEPAKGTPSSPGPSPQHVTTEANDPSAPAPNPGQMAAEQAPPIASHASPSHSGRDPRAPNGHVMQQQQAPSQAADPGAPNQAAAPGAPNQAAQPPPGKIELDFKTLGALAAALGVGTVKLPTAAPTQPAISQGHDPRMAGQPQPMPYPQPGAFPAGPTAQQPGQWAPQQQQQQQQQQPFQQQPGQFGQPQFAQPGQPFQAQQPPAQAPGQGPQQPNFPPPPTLPRPVTLPVPQPAPITLQPPGATPQPRPAAPITLRPPQPAGPPAPIRLRPPGPITLRPPGPPAATARGRGGGGRARGRGGRAGRDAGRAAAVAPEAPRSSRPKVMGPGAAAVAGYRPVSSPGHSGEGRR